MLRIVDIMIEEYIPLFKKYQKTIEFFDNESMSRIVYYYISFNNKMIVC